MKKHFEKILCSFLTMFVFVSCLTLEPIAETEQKQGSEEIKPASTKVAVQEPRLYKGGDITIAVLKPTLSNISNDSIWISQFLQDSITGKFARFTKMRVVDRLNEELVKAELRKSESIYYTDEECIEVGQMLNAKHVTFGSVQKINGSYNLIFRINDIEKNEICASAEGRYPLSDLESGYAANDITLQLIDGLGIELTGSEKNKLSEINSSENSSVKNLAKGSVAGNSGNIIEALDFYSEVDGSYQSEAERNIQQLLDGTIPTDNIKERAAFFQKQKEKWEKTFKDLDSYLRRKMPVVIYDFSYVKDELYGDLKTVDYTIEPGIKIIPNRTAMIVWKEVYDAWYKLIANEDYAPLKKSGIKPVIAFPQICVTVSLYDDAGTKISCKKTYQNIRIQHEIKSVKKNYNSVEFQKLKFERIKIEDIEGNLTPKIDSIALASFGDRLNEIENPAVYSAEEWAELMNQN